MPIYEYQCENCAATCELLQKVSDPPKTQCLSCGEETLKRLVSSTSFQLKGTGWYVTDFRDKGKPPKKPDASQSSEDKKMQSKSSDTTKTKD